jgi:hypothetical protein
VHDLRQHEVAWARPVRVVLLAPMRALDLRGRMRSLGVNLSFNMAYSSSARYIRGYNLRQRHSNCTEVMEGTIPDHSRRGGADHGKRTRSDGVRHGKCRGGNRAAFAVLLAILELVAGTQKDGPHRARQGKPKV